MGARRLAAALAALTGAAAWACPVCGLAANDATQEAYKSMSIIISLVPLALIGGIVGWVALRMRAARRAEEATLAPARLTPYRPSDASQR